MSTEALSEQSGLVSEAQVAGYLREHPEFFKAHPELLADIDVPHVSGDAVSLVERQVRILREQNEQNQKRVQELIDIARHNEELAGRVHQLALAILDAEDIGQMFSSLYAKLCHNFNADQVVIRLFAEPAFEEPPGPEFVGTEAAEEQLFSSLIKRGQPLSGHLKRQQQVFLFGDDGDDIRSAVMVPLQGPGWGGILAIGSTSKERFQEGMGLELLANMGEILSAVLNNWIASSYSGA